MQIITGCTLNDQGKDFAEMVTNAKKGDLFLYSTRFMNSGGMATLFLVESCEKITTRFGNRDRILSGWEAYEKNDVVHLIQKSKKWCSNLAHTEKFQGKFKIANKNKIVV